MFNVKESYQYSKTNYQKMRKGSYCAYGSLSSVWATQILNLPLFLLINLKYLLRIYIKAKAVSLHATKVLVGRGGIAPTHSLPQH
jgi:hypothetical protein